MLYTYIEPPNEDKYYIVDFKNESVLRCDNLASTIFKIKDLHPQPYDVAPKEIAVIIVTDCMHEDGFAFRIKFNNKDCDAFKNPFFIELTSDTIAQSKGDMIYISSIWNGYLVSREITCNDYEFVELLIRPSSFYCAQLNNGFIPGMFTLINETLNEFLKERNFI